MIQFSKRQKGIFKATGEVIQQEGIAELTTKKIANRVGFTEGALYRHFKGKNEIIEGVLTHIKQEIEALYLMIDPFLEPEDAFQAVFECQFLFFNDHSHFVDIAFSKALIVDQPFKPSVEDLIRMTEQQVLAAVEAGQKKGVLNCDLPAEALTQIAMGAFRFEMLNWSLNQYRDQLLVRGELLIEHLLLLFKTRLT